MLQRSWLMLILIATCLAGPASGQLHKDATHGFKFNPPKEYKAVALSPGDFLTLAKYQAEQEDSNATSRYTRMFEITYWPIMRTKDGEDGADGADGEDGADGAPGEDGEPGEDGGAGGDGGDGGDGASSEEAPPPRKESKSGKNKEADVEDDALDQFVRQLIDRQWGFCDVEKEKIVKVAGGRGKELTLSSTSKPIKVFLLILDQPDGRFVFEGTALDSRFDKAVSDFTKSAHSFARIEKEDTTSHDAELSQMSEQERFLQRQIDKLPPGWSHMRTKRYLFLYNADKDFVKELGERIEAMRNVYEIHYPPTAPIEAVSIVRVCNSVEEYMGYGGPSGTGGYWNSRERELVVFDFRPRELTLAVLNHEAFHQFIYYFYGELSPHSWYNEGTGDYYAGAKLNKSGRVASYGDAPGGIGRSGTIKEAARLLGEGKTGKDGACPPLKKVMHFHQSDYYGAAGYDPGICYAQGWAIVHFLREGKGLDPKWQKILPDYLTALLDARHKVANELMLKAIAEAEKAKAGSSEDMSKEPKDWYGRVDEDTVQDRAFDATFKDWTDDDWAKFQAAWLKYVEKV